MKRLLLLILLLNCISSYPQFNNSAPWNSDDKLSKSGPKTIDVLVDSFNKYWENRDKSVKGSGYKPFMRWENHWRNNTNSQGYLITPQEMWNAFYQKKARSFNRSSSSVLVPTNNWEPIGPFTHTNTGSWSSGQGRVNVVYQDPTNSNVLYIGTPAGGIWKSLNSGTNCSDFKERLRSCLLTG